MLKNILLEMNISFLENYLKVPPSGDIQVLNKAFIIRFFGYSNIIAATFLTISLVICVISLFFSFEIYNTSKIKKIITDTAVAIFFLSISKYLINWGINGSNLFSSLWFEQKENKNIIEFLLKSASIDEMQLITLNLAFQLIIFITLFTIFLFYVFNNLVGLTLAVTIILYPLSISLYPTNFFKKTFKNFNTLILSLFLVSPLQGLCITIASKLLLNYTFSIYSVASLFSLMIMITFLIPGLFISSFSRLFQQ